MYEWTLVASNIGCLLSALVSKVAATSVSAASRKPPLIRGRTSTPQEAESSASTGQHPDGNRTKMPS